MSLATTADDHAGPTLRRRLIELVPGIGLLFIVLVVAGIFPRVPW